MKTTVKTNKVILQATLLSGLVLGVVACNNNQANTQGNTMTNTGTNSDSTNNKKDVAFLNKAAEINLEEIKVGQLAQQNGTMPEVKEMGKMLETDHTKSWNELTALAAKKSITIPTTLDSNAQKDCKTLSDKTGNEFDKKFCDMMIEGHKDAIALFEKESTEAKDSDIRHWAAATLPTLHKHLDDAINCKQNVK